MSQEPMSPENADDEDLADDELEDVQGGVESTSGADGLDSTGDPTRDVGNPAT